MESALLCQGNSKNGCRGELSAPIRYYGYVLYKLQFHHRDTESTENYIVCRRGLSREQRQGREKYLTIQHQSLLVLLVIDEQH